jgi:mannan endo-1,4-beta-mannosidase
MRSSISGLFAVVQLTMLSCGAAEDSPLFGFAIDGLPAKSELNTIESTTKIRPRLVMFYLQWPSKAGECEFPERPLRAIDSQGAIPVLSWEPMFLDSERRENAISAQSVSAGKYDLYIEEFARRSRQFAKPFLIRFAHEMNLERYHWGGNPKEFGPLSPVGYRAMFRHVVTVFRAQNANNVHFVFCPNVDSIPAESWNRISYFYPGNDVVDVVGLDGYNWGTTQTRLANGWDSQWRSFESIFEAPFIELKRIAPGKPIAVFETSSAMQGGNKEEWVLEMLRYAKSLGLAALIWFQVNKEIDWRLETGVSESVRSLIDMENRSAAWRAVLLDR